MHVLHVTAHLGGGVGKAHAALRAAMPAGIRQTCLLLEEPRDRRYADEISAHGGEIVFARDLDHVAELCAAADIVQFEFWNHPKLFECLALTDFPAMRSVFWAHISGLFKPVIAPGLLTAADRFVFTTPASMVLGEGLSEAQRLRLSAIGSGFGFKVGASPPSALPGISPSKGENDSRRSLHSSHFRSTASECSLVARTTLHPISPLEGEMPGRAQGGEPGTRSDITYLGTVDFIKMHPGFFDAVDALKHDASAAIWGGHDAEGDVAAKAKAMRHPERIRFMGQTADPQAALLQSGIFFYPLQPDHYGTAENALIEAMSLGLVPVVLANPSECAIIDHGITGFIGETIGDCIEILDMLLESPETLARVGKAAAAHIAAYYNAARSAHAFESLWRDVMTQPKRQPQFADIVGSRPLDWFLASQYLPGEARDSIADTGKLSKGTLSHFRSAFPDDPCWDAI